MEIVLPTLFHSWASYFHGIDTQEAVQKKTIEPSELWTQTELRAKRIFGWEEKTSSNEMNIVTCLCDVWMVFFFSWYFTFLRVFACHHLLHAVHFQPKFLHFKQTMCEILTCKIEPERKRREREQKRTRTIWFEKQLLRRLAAIKSTNWQAERNHIRFFTFSVIFGGLVCHGFDIVLGVNYFEWHWKQYAAYGVDDDDCNAYRWPKPRFSTCDSRPIFSFCHRCHSHNHRFIRSAYFWLAFLTYSQRWMTMMQLWQLNHPL